MAMRLQGYRIVRVNNVEVYENLDGVLETIFAALERCETW
jgi:very-short-patch-repair endonuclease